MSADGGEYVSRDRVAVLEREERARQLRINKRQIAADVLRGELAADLVAVHERATIERMISHLEVTT